MNCSFLTSEAAPFRGSTTASSQFSEIRVNLFAPKEQKSELLVSHASEATGAVPLREPPYYAAWLNSLKIELTNLLKKSKKMSCSFLTLVM